MSRYAIMSLPTLILIFVAIASGSASKPTIVRSVSDCGIDADGILHYHGIHALTKFNHECLPWSDLQTTYPAIINEPNFFEDTSIKAAKNYCRNPTLNEDGPWCFVANGNGSAMEQCDVCHSLPATSTVATDETTVASVDKGFWERVHDELKRVGAYIRERFLKVVERIKAKFRNFG